MLWMMLKGHPVRFSISPGQPRDSAKADESLRDRSSCIISLVERADDTDRIRRLAHQRGEWTNILPKKTRHHLKLDDNRYQ